MFFRSIVAAATFASLLGAPAMAADSMSSSMKPAGCPPPPRFGGQNYCGAPALQNTLSLVVAGGGPKNFDTVKAFGVLAGPATKAEAAKLTKQYGAAGFGLYVKTFNFVINDALKIVTAKKVALPSTPAPSPKDGKALSAALYMDGVQDGTFSVEGMLDKLVTHGIHVQVMKDIDANPALGPKADAAYHAVTAEIFADLKAAYKL